MYLVSPKRVFKGNKAWEKALPEISKLTKSPLLIGRSNATYSLRKKITEDLDFYNSKVINETLLFDCCEEDLDRIYNKCTSYHCDAIIAAGGGKVLDAGKILAYKLSIPCITVPLSASTCAGWTALGNIYSKHGQFIKDINLRSCPDIFVFDYSFIKTAPTKTLTSGIADSLAKWYESSITSSSNKDGLVQQAIQISRVLRDQLFLESEEALADPAEGNLAWRNVIEGNSLTAGLIGGIGGEKCRTAAAHAIHNAITQLQPKNKPLHGEIVGVGILIQLKLEEVKNDNKLADQTMKQLAKFMKKLDLPTTVAELGIDLVENNNLQRIADFTCRKESEIHFLPFSVSPDDVVKTISIFENQKIII
tara:strand:+ start:2262 stop:3353 length:1092 start_codon:yes stop_codon:yes gene_type:complete